ncbi:sensor histidine kinase [Pseudonocardia endophytica]|uniref:sensor histidine kinase n=1 Tax=Pseudonocardia endophytica TaxID=401976 RepID=UPI00104F99CF|nr:ATP-binding protein [Pseudonocardia endophytica]
MPRPGRVPQRRSRLVRRLLALQVVTVLLTVGGLAALAVWGAQQIQEEAAGRLTRATAAALAGDPAVVDALTRGGDVAALSARMQPLAERVRAASNTGFVVVMAPDGTRYSHAEPDRIGGVYQGTLAPALAGRTLTEVFPGTLGPSVRTVVPVLSGDRVVGAVSVGVLQTRVSDLALLYLPWIAVSAGVALLLGVGLAVLVARRLRRQTLGLEPEEITAAYTHHDAVLHAVGEGLLVVDGDGHLVVVNAEARRLLALGPDGSDPTLRDATTSGPTPRNAGIGSDAALHNGGTDGSPTTPDARTGDNATSGRPAIEADPAAPGTRVDGLAADPAVLAVLDRGLREDLRDEPALAGERVLLVNSRTAGPAAGPGTRVFTLRDRTELAGALRERDDARDKVAALSAQAHEFGNRLQTVLTLMELGDTADATRAGVAALDRSRGPGAAVAAEVVDPVLAALLADKAWTATDGGVTLVVTDRHRPGDLPGDRLPYSADDLLSLVGNLVDNALEAVAAVPHGSPREVRVTLGPDPDPDHGTGGLELEIADTGPGIPDDVVAELFTYGFSTRAEGADRPRGIGLALVDRITRRLGGTVEVVSAGQDGGTVFTVRLPAPDTGAATTADEPAGAAPGDLASDAPGPDLPADARR